jgi:hypothetical protein
MWTKPGHNQVRWHVEQHIADIEQRQTSRDLLRGKMKYGGKVVAFVRVHRLSKSDIGPDG